MRFFNRGFDEKEQTSGYGDLMVGKSRQVKVNRICWFLPDYQVFIRRIELIISPIAFLSIIVKFGIETSMEQV